MRILRVAQKLYPEVTGGGPYHVHAMSRDQAAMGHDVTVLTVSDDASLPRTERRDGYTVVRYPSTATLLGNELSAGVAQFLQTAAEFDVVHAHSHLYASTNLAALKRRLGVVANGVDTERFRPAGPTSELIDHDGPVILFVGRLVNGKHPQDAVDAVASLPDELNAKCYVVGDGPLKDDLAARGGDAVEFLGHVHYDEMPKVYRSGDALLLTSRAEGLPRTVLEAFASGLPVVSSHLEHTAPVVNRGGETVPVGDIDGYSAAIERVLADQDRLEAEGRTAATAEFQWFETVSKTTAALESLL